VAHRSVTSRWTACPRSSRSRQTLIVYTSNIFAILGLRALYFALAAMVHRFHYLKYALSGGVIVSLLRTREAEPRDGMPKAAE
jgi:predicted tellurium resistance membrane protein TerC